MKNNLSAKAAKLFDSLPWPGPDNEAWRRTHLERLLPKGTLDAAAASPPPGTSLIDASKLSPAGAQDAETCFVRIITSAGCPQSIYVSEEARATGVKAFWESAENFPAGLEALENHLFHNPDRVQAWHWRNTPGAAIVQIPKGACLNKPILIEETLSADGKNLFSAPHVHIEAGGGSEAEIIWSLHASEASLQGQRPVVNAGITGTAEANSKLRVTLRQKLKGEMIFFLNNLFQAERDALVLFMESHTGSSLVKTHTSAILDGEGSEIRLNGLYLAGKDQHIDIGTLQDHRAPRAVSDALYKGAVYPGGWSVYQGLIQVQHDAAKTDAYLTNNNLLLGDGARADSLPQLNILTDDVKCSHGSTSGKLDSAQLFYLQSRGFPPVEAERALTEGFLAETLKNLRGHAAELLHTDLELALKAGTVWADG
ncbi:MAG: hypothetical protein B0D92_07270 [Spirochaeta sp. LUC14_002_19_P3]|nr:MAG: hypothetical protein B0D92_07270 [Spirochaeta sp. LUC14_002_19_P3]